MRWKAFRLLNNRIFSEPRVLALDFDDEPLIYGMPADRKDDFDQMMGAGGQFGSKIDRKEQQFTKKSKMILGQVQQRQKQEAEEQVREFSKSRIFGHLLLFIWFLMLLEQHRSILKFRKSFYYYLKHTQFFFIIVENLGKYFLVSEESLKCLSIELFYEIFEAYSK